MRGLVLFGADAVPNGVEVLASVHAAKEHARVAFQHQAAGAVHLHDLREAVLRLPVGVEEEVLGRVGDGDALLLGVDLGLAVVPYGLD